MVMCNHGVAEGRGRCIGGVSTVSLVDETSRVGSVCHWVAIGENLRLPGDHLVIMPTESSTLVRVSFLEFHVDEAGASLEVLGKAHAVIVLLGACLTLPVDSTVDSVLLYVLIASYNRHFWAYDLLLITDITASYNLYLRVIHMNIATIDVVTTLIHIASNASVAGQALA